MFFQKIFVGLLLIVLSAEYVSVQRNAAWQDIISLLEKTTDEEEAVGSRFESGIEWKQADMYSIYRMMMADASGKHKGLMHVLECIKDRGADEIISPPPDIRMF